MKIVASVAAAWLLGGSAAAAEPGLPAAIADGMYVTVAEVRANSMDTFQAFAGPSGAPVTKEQFVSTRVPQNALPSSSEQAALAKLFGMLDADANGRLTLQEWRAGISKDISFADQNDDGRITLKELSHARQNMSFGDALGMVF